MTRRDDVPNRDAHAERGDARAACLRLDRVTLAKERIKSRYYERPDVRRALVEALLVELAL